MPLEFPMRGEKAELSPTIRGRLPGAFIQLPDGVVHYELEGPEDAPVVVLVHGFTVPYFIWDPTFEALIEAGYRVLRYDLYGRGFSDRPHTKYNLDLFDRQLVSLLEMLDIAHCLAVFGLSMGGVVAANFAVQHSELIDRLVLIDPAGFPQMFPLIYRVVNLPVLGELAFALMSEKSLTDALSGDFYDPQHVETFIDQYRPQMEYKGFKRAVLSTIRAGVAEKGERVYRKLGKLSNMPVLLVWGQNDTTVPFKYSQTLLKWVPQAQFHPIADSKHIPHYEQAEQVNPILLDFLRG